MKSKLHYRKRSNGLPILSMKEIDGFAEVLLSDFDASVLKEPAPVDIEALIELYLELNMDYQDLTHNRSILGMTVFNDCRIPVYDEGNGIVKILPVNEKTVLIDNSLLAEDQEPRRRFTLGHEAGHWIFHRHKYREDKQQTSLFKAESGQPVVKCRAGDIENATRRNNLFTDHDWLEWQADYAASAILMPKSVFRSAAQTILGQAGISEGYIAKGISEDLDRFLEEVPFELARIFHVSVQAATIRCNKLGVIKEKAGVQSVLF